ncbi:MAG: efflux RND transporter periplasmic adaptor subunit [Alphaproteobacteria bacterium]|nr:efflux RND transporter periplasmic adaptor subunit [Alphaproteobacteria bacterium]
MAADNRSVRALVTAKQHTLLSSQIAGKLLRLEVRGGETIRKGQSLATLDCAVQRAQLAESRAEMVAADKALSVNRQLAGLQSGSALDTASAEANLGKAKARVEMAEATLAMCDVRAPFDGRVVERRAEPFQNVAAGQVLLEIQDDSQLEVDMIVPSGWIAWLKVGSVFTLAVDETGRTYPGRISRLGVRIDPASQSLRITGELSKTSPDLLPGMSGEAQFGKP